MSNKVVLITVGTGRNREDIAGAITFSLRHHDPAGVVFLCSPQTHQETMPLILAQLTWPPERYLVHVCDDENDIEKLFADWNERWTEWLSHWPDPSAIVDYTGGTKPMSAAAFALAIARGAEQVSYVTGPRDETGRVIKSDKVLTLSPDLIVAHRQLQLARAHFHAGNYAAARDTASPFLKIDSRLCFVAKSLYLIGKAYALWDRFAYKHAAARFREALKFSTDWNWIHTQAFLEENQRIVQAARDPVKRNELSDALCADLLGNVKRCLKRMAWDDALARLYRACEMIAQLRLKKAHGISTNDVDPEKTPESFRAEYRNRQKASRIGKLKLGLVDAFELLNRLDDPVGRLFSINMAKTPSGDRSRDCWTPETSRSLLMGYSRLRRNKHRS